MAAKDKHDAVALLNTEGLEVVRALVTLAAQILEREAALHLVDIEVDHRKLLGVLAGDAVDDVKREVEFVGVDEIDVLEAALLILVAADEFVADEAALCGVAGHKRVRHILFRGVRIRKDHGEERHILLVDGDHAVRRGTLVENAVTLAEDLDMVTDLNFHAALEHEVELLAGVRRRVDRFLLLLRRVLVANPVGLGELVLEHRREVLDQDALLFRRHLALAVSRHRVGRKLGRVTFGDRRKLYVKCLRAFVDKGERKVFLSFLIQAVLILAHFRESRCLGNAHTGDLAQFADTGRNFHQLAVNCLIHWIVLLASWLCCFVVPVVMDATS